MDSNQKKKNASIRKKIKLDTPVLGGENIVGSIKEVLTMTIKACKAIQATQRKCQQIP